MPLVTMALAVKYPLVSTGIVGVMTHIVVNRYEPESVKSMLALLFLPTLSLAFALQIQFSQAFFTYIMTLSLSMVIYRISPFHPLAKYPGPFFARISRLWWSHASLNGRQHYHMRQLHEKYGDVVRTGPNHLSFRDPSVMTVTHGARNPWPKSAMYDVVRPYDDSEPLINLVHADHAKRRRLWDRAFTPGSLASYTPMLHARLSELIAALTARAGTGARVDLALWIQFMALDFMGDFAYGGEFNSLRDGQDPGGLLTIMTQGLIFGQIAGAVPWVRPFFAALASGPANRLFTAARTVGERRKKRGTGYKDLFYYLLGEDGSSAGEEPMHPDTMAQEAVTALIAGSDTSSRTMANAFFYLLANPKALARVRAEVDTAAQDMADADGFLDPSRLVNLPFLQAVINETLRLQPLVPSGTPRVHPRGGGPMAIKHHIIPEGTGVQISSYALQRDSRYFAPYPDTFWPERWLPEGRELAAKEGEEFVLSTAAYAPFSFGPHNCAGRSIALLEIRQVLAELVRGFDIQFAEGMTEELWWEGVKDRFVLTTGPLWVLLQKRS